MARLAAYLLAALLLAGGIEASRVGAADLSRRELEANGTGGSVAAARLLHRRARALLQSQAWFDTSRTFDQRVAALLAQMTASEKVMQMESTPAGPISRLGVTQFNYQRECLHGMVGEYGESVMYPSPMAWGATFDDALVQKAASEIGDAMRAFSNAQVRAGAEPSFTHCFGPHPAIARDPRWGRTSEVYSEDPRVASNMAGAFVKGLQASPTAGVVADNAYLKVSATCKHLIGNDLENWNGYTRYNFNAQIASADLRDTYWPPFVACVLAGSASVMCSYNMVNGLPACLSAPLLSTTLRSQLGFKGFVSTDCKALDGYATPQPAGMGYGSLRSVSAQAVKAGSDLACQNFDGLDTRDITASQLNTAAGRVLRNRFRLGHFNSAYAQPYNSLSTSVIGSAAHVATARKIAGEGIVLLKNTGGTLPLKAASVQRVHVVGTFANSALYSLGSYYSIPQGANAASYITPLQALRNALLGKTVTFNSASATSYSSSNVRADINSCNAADTCIIFLGSRTYRYLSHSDNWPSNSYDPVNEGEGHDRTSLLLNSNQEAMWKQLAGGVTTARRLIVVLIHGGPVDISSMMAHSRVGAVVTAWYPAQGMMAIPDVLLGTVPPSGRLPTSWYKDSYTALPMTDMRMRASGTYPGRTHRYWKGEAPLFPFGYGLSYTTWIFTQPALAAASTTSATASISLKNTGTVASDYVVMLFMRYSGTSGTGVPAPAVTFSGTGCTSAGRTDLVQALVGYQRLRGVAHGATVRAAFALQYVKQTTLLTSMTSSWAGFGDTAPPCGVYSLHFGHDQPATLSLRLSA